MKKKFAVIVILIVIMSTLTVNSFAVTWIDNAYLWGRQNQIVDKKTTSQLLQNVNPEEFYDILFKYFEITSMKTIKMSYKRDSYAIDNYVLAATDETLTSLAFKDYITVNEYKKGDKLIANARNILNSNRKYFTDEERNAIMYYLDNMQYILYSKIYDYNYKEKISVKKTKNGDNFIKYNVIPFYGIITREEFLNLMFFIETSTNEAQIASDRQATFYATSKMINKYRGSVLLGYNNNLMLTCPITYAQLLAFLSRM